MTCRAVHLTTLALVASSLVVEAPAIAAAPTRPTCHGRAATIVVKDSSPTVVQGTRRSDVVVIMSAAVRHRVHPRRMGR
ncbi:hypothetical protein BH11ACT8_BH11ACT8_01530 [soil metagenome]